MVFGKRRLSPHAARPFLEDFNFSQADALRIAALGEACIDSVFTAEDRAEYNGYVNFADLVAFVHAKARRSFDMFERGRRMMR